ncbi:MAG: hypothetical protein N2Z59_04010 [Alteraurantiacibacter sp.]|nr:hypothetical protein [Alteraurantiacibacter sp.]
MAQKLNISAIAAHADIHAEPPATARVRAPHVVDRTFELPRGIYAATVGCYLTFLATTGLAFSHAEMIIPMAIFVLFILGGFGLAAVWTKLAPEAPRKAMSWARFQRDGIAALTGHNAAGAATVQVLILPVLIAVWGFAVVTIAALVR